MTTEVKERPILFSAPMVRAILDGAKTQTRRVCKLPQNGDRLYVRETWAAPHAYDHLPPRLIPQDARIHYAATEDRGGLLWRTSIHMPRWASRILLEITEVRVERLQDISEVDALAEGVFKKVGHSGPFDTVETATGRLLHYVADTQAREEFQRLWQSINGPDSLDANPFVRAISFKRVEAS